MRDVRYTLGDWLTTGVVVIVAWAAFFTLLGLLARAAKELFCLGFGC